MATDISDAKVSRSPIKKKYDVYISYSAHDSEWIHAGLIPRLNKNRISYFIDSERLKLSDVWPDNLTEGIRLSRSLVVVLSKAFIFSDFAQKELDSFIYQLKLDETVLIPLLLEEVKIPDPFIGYSYINFADYRNLESERQELLWQQLIDRIKKEIKKQRNQEKETQNRPREVTLNVDDGYQKQSGDTATIHMSSIPSEERVGTPTITSSTIEQVQISDVTDATVIRGDIDQSSSKEEEIEVKGKALSDTYSEVDLLGYEDYVQALGDFIESSETQKPLVIGIDAPWGGGKTSLMHMLEKRLGPQPIPGRHWFWEKKTTGSFFTVWFNAWKYDQEESLWAAMVLEILQQVRKQLGFRRRLGMSFSLNWNRFDFPAFFIDLGKSLLFALALGTVSFIAFIGLAFLLDASWIETVNWLRYYVKVLAGFGLISVLYTGFKDVAGVLVSPFNLGISKYLKTPKYKEKVGFLGQFQEDFKGVVETVTVKGKWPLVIFIDDLDRCTPGKAAAVIEAINLLLDSEYCVFIIGMDARVLASSIQAKYKDLQEFFCDPDNPGGLSLGRKFLEKIIQIDFHVPRPAPDRINEFIDINLGRPPSSQPEDTSVNPAERMIMAEQRSGKSLEEAQKSVEQLQPELAAQLAEAVQSIRARSFEDDPDVQQAVRDAAPYFDFNPRKIKRYINLFRLQALIAYRRGVLETVVSFDILGRWIIINLRWPEFFELAVEKPEIVQTFFDISDKCTQATPDGKKKIMEGIANTSLSLPQISQLIENQDLHQLLTGIPRSPEDVKSYLQLLQVSSPAVAE